MLKNLVLDCKLSPNNLHTDYKSKIILLLKNEYENNCTNAGYIITVNKIKEFIHNKIIEGNILIKMLCECDVYKPKIDDIITCKVNMIHINGIFVNKYNIKILIPNTLNIFDIRDNKCFYKNNIINIGDNIDVIIKQIRFENFNFTCIGNIT
tara:strand:- start:692 stop:1147 length:456 start_codon:yes stop_codon:yes gene_type:complete